MSYRLPAQTSENTTTAKENIQKFFADPIIETGTSGTTV